MHIRVCVEVTVDQALNSTTNDSCTAGTLKLLSANKTGSCKNVSTFLWHFQWTDSALFSLITIDQLISFDVFSSAIFSIIKGRLSVHNRLYRCFIAYCLSRHAYRIRPQNLTDVTFELGKTLVDSVSTLCSHGIYLFLPLRVSLMQDTMEYLHNGRRQTKDTYKNIMVIIHTIWLKVNTMIMIFITFV